MTPLPKRRHSSRRTGLRRSQQANHLKMPQTIKCKKCGELRLPNIACPSCGTYR